MMKRLAYLVVILLGCAAVTMAEQVEVSGKVINGSGLTIRAMTWKDQLTYLKETLTTETIGPDGHFQLSFETNTTRYIWLDIAFQQAELFVQPGRSYEVEITLLNQDIATSYYDRFGLPVKIIRDDPDKLNLYIQDFNQLYNDFLLSFTDNIGLRNSSALFETFSKAVRLRFQNATNPYFSNYVAYKMAGMQLFLRLKSRDNLGMEYLAGKPVLHENVEYMDFFHLYFEKYFLAGGKFLNYNKTYDLINGKTPLAVLLDTLKADPVLPDSETRELLLLLGLKELHSTSGFNRKHIEFLIEELSVSAVSKENRMIASNLLESLSRLQPGSPAPAFNAVGVSDGKMYSLEDFRGYHLYVVFFESGNLASLAEMALVDDIAETFSQKVKFVAVAVDKDLEKLGKYAGSGKWPWLILHYGGNFQMLEDYDASTFPHFILIDDQGRIIRCPAPSPSENIDRIFQSL